MIQDDVCDVLRDFVQTLGVEGIDRHHQAHPPFQGMNHVRLHADVPPSVPDSLLSADQPPAEPVDLVAEAERIVKEAQE